MAAGARTSCWMRSSASHAPTTTSSRPTGKASTPQVTLSYFGEQRCTMGWSSRAPRQRAIRGPVWITPGQPDDTFTVQLGYGRQRAGSNGSGLGYNAYALRASGAPWFDTGVTLSRTGERYVLATTQFDQLTEGRDLVQ